MNKSVRAALAPMAVAAVLIPTAALALPATMQMTCRQAATLIRTGGSAVLATSATTYDRFVISRAYCPADQMTEPAWVPTRDSRQCFIGYTCFDPTRDRR
ncbi:hypothetical protein [Azorhizobium doebereinerae]|uniref:hypothetical protein n=1 Tax=Azorhizobium doebereinerae TaxID=281091 RepID=UPI00054E5D45|nr:hypothetical protein [Azorhizobium doebereinerae]